MMDELRPQARASLRNGAAANVKNRSLLSPHPCCLRAHHGVQVDVQYPALHLWAGGEYLCFEPPAP
eukprot:CAMPEP_0173289142 /NCGR_PEP_ID=MMETSP1143-20121109/10814_1 /TAXON_ID=483371 /ORGANISM="non described non described, Strain CCMP2298" /LENGTH=65 /DNA_ID=CAMNT_0014227997 /DNA_START=806 /DNA_END=1000 /DNA_ORIENTATION=+